MPSCAMAGGKGQRGRRDKESSYYSSSPHSILLFIFLTLIYILYSIERSEPSVPVVRDFMKKCLSVLGRGGYTDRLISTFLI